MAEDARAFLQQHDLPALLPWLDHARGEHSRRALGAGLSPCLRHTLTAAAAARVAGGAAPAGLEPEVAGQLRRLLRLHIVKSLKPESKAAQKAAAQEVVAGLASWLPRALAAGQLPDSLNGLLDVLKEQRCWAHLDVLAAACVEL